MRICRFEWDKGNIEHIARHQVIPEEAEEIFLNKHILRTSRDGRYLAFGQTSEGRYLVVVHVQSQGSIRVITARDMTRAERKYFTQH